MVVSRNEAVAAMLEVEAAAARSTALRRYQSAAPHLILWGALWAVGYTANWAAPVWAGPIWGAIVIGGTLIDVLIARRDRPGKTMGAWWRSAALFASVYLFILATFAVLVPTDSRQIGAFIPLVAALGYAIAGVFLVPRLLLVGALVAGLTLFGFFALHADFLLWMAAVGGLTLVSSGLWLRRV